MALMTREQLREFLNEVGYPIGKSTFNKICAPAIGEGPPIVKWWGRRPLYDPDKGLQWAEARCRPSEQQPAA